MPITRSATIKKGSGKRTVATNTRGGGVQKKKSDRNAPKVRNNSKRGLTTTSNNTATFRTRVAKKAADAAKAVVDAAKGAASDTYRKPRMTTRSQVKKE